MPFSHESINFVRHENRYEFLWVRVIASLYSKRAAQVMCNQSDKKVRHFPKNITLNILKVIKHSGLPNKSPIHEVCEIYLASDCKSDYDFIFDY